MTDGGAAVVLPDAELTPDALRAAVDAILLDGARLAAMGEAATAPRAPRRGGSRRPARSLAAVRRR